MILMAAGTLSRSGRPPKVTQRSSARYRRWPFRCCSSPGSAWLAEHAGERGDGFEQQRVDAGLLVGGAAGAELGDGAAVPGLGGELAHPVGFRNGVKVSDLLGCQR